MDTYIKVYNESCKVSSLVYRAMNDAFKRYYPSEEGYYPNEDNAYKFCCIGAMEEVIRKIESLMFPK